MNEQAISSRHLDIMYKQKQDPLEDIQAILGQCADKLPAEERADSGLGLYSDSGSEFGRRNSDENESRPCSSARSLSQNTSAGDSIGSSRSASGRPSPSPSPLTSLANVRPAMSMMSADQGGATGDGETTEREIAKEKEVTLDPKFVELVQECYALQRELDDGHPEFLSSSPGGRLGFKPDLIVPSRPNVKLDSYSPDDLVTGGLAFQRQLSLAEKDGLHDDKKKAEAASEGSSVPNRSSERGEECDGPNLLRSHNGIFQIIKFPWQNHRHQVPQQNTAMNLRPNYHAPPPNSAAGMDPRNDPHCFPAEAEARVTHTQGQTQAGDGRPHHHCQMNGYMGYVEQERTGTVVSGVQISFFYVDKDASDVKSTLVVAIGDNQKVSLRFYHNPQPNDEKIQLDPQGTLPSDKFYVHSGNMYMGLDLTGASPQLIALVEEDFQKKAALYREEMKAHTTITFIPIIKVLGEKDIALRFDGQYYCYYIKPENSPPSSPPSSNQLSPVLSIERQPLRSDFTLFTFFRTNP